MADYSQFVQEDEDRRKKSLADTVAPAKPKPIELNPQKLVNTMNDLAVDPKFQEEAPTSSRESLAAAMDRAQKLYQEKATRNEWLEVAQMLGRAGSQYLAAREGLRSGRDMSNLNFAPPVDYGHRTEQAQQDYQQELRNLGSLEGVGREESRDRSAYKKAQYGREMEPLEKGLKSAEDEKERQLRREIAGKQESAADRRQRDAEEKERNRQAEADRKADLADLALKEKDLAIKEQKAQSVVNRMLKEPDLDSKTIKKFDQQYPDLAAQAGIDLDKLEAKMEASDTPGRFYGTNPDPAARKQILKDEVARVSNLLEAVRARKQQLLNRELVPLKQSEGTVRVKYNNRILEIQKDKLQEALDDGAELVE